MKTRTCLLSAAAAAAALTLSAAPAAAWEADGVISVQGGGCLDVHAPDMTRNGGRVQMWACNAQPQQRWSFDSASGTLRNEGGLCLDVHAPELETEGGRVQVWACNGQPQQRWVVDRARGNILAASGLCLGSQQGQQANNGTPVRIGACTGQPHQNWTFQPVSGGAPSGGSQPDLTPIIAAFAEARIADGVMLGIEIDNLGGATAAGTDSAGTSGWMVDIVLSSDTTVPSGFVPYNASYREDVLLAGGRMSNTPNIAGGDRYRFGAPSYDNGPYSFPADTPPGDYYLCLSVDPANVIAESREDNNIVCQGIRLIP